MSDFTKVYPAFWEGELFRKFCETDELLCGTALYLKTNRHSNMLGIYCLPLGYMALDLNITVQEAQRRLQLLIDFGFCRYDETHQYIWVVEAAFEQLGKLNKKDNKVTHIKKQLSKLPPVHFLKNVIQRYQDSFHLDDVDLPTKPVDFIEEIQIEEKPLQSNIDIDVDLDVDLRNKYNKKINKKNADKHTSSSPGQCLDAQARPRLVESQIIFTHWQTVMNHPQAKLDDKRKTAIRKALKLGYSTKQLCDAIDGCAKTPHNMGDNDRGQRYDGLQLILRSADHIDRFIANAKNPPVSKSRSNDATLDDGGYIEGLV